MESTSVVTKDVEEENDEEDELHVSIKEHLIGSTIYQNRACSYHISTSMHPRECVMCLCEELSAMFLPCAHQVLCRDCNEIHKRKEMERLKRNVMGRSN